MRSLPLAQGYLILKPKIPISVYFGNCNGKCWFILWPFGICTASLNICGQLENFTVNWNILRSIGIFYYILEIFWSYLSPFWHIVRRKIWQPCSRLLPTPVNVLFPFKAVKSKALDSGANPTKDTGLLMAL
jgi:hypothetical protein